MPYQTDWPTFHDAVEEIAGRVQLPPSQVRAQLQAMIRDGQIRLRTVSGGSLPTNLNWSGMRAAYLGRELLLYRPDFDKWFPPTGTAAKGRRGPPPGATGKAAEDAKYLPEIIRRMKAGSRSKRAAVKEMIAAGAIDLNGAQEASVIDRITRRFVKASK